MGCVSIVRRITKKLQSLAESEPSQAGSLASVTAGRAMQSCRTEYANVLKVFRISSYPARSSKVRSGNWGQCGFDSVMRAILDAVERRVVTMRSAIEFIGRLYYA